MKIIGTVVHKKLGVGFWGIEDENGGKWRSTEMPSELQKEGLKIEAEIEMAANQVSVFMWGKAVELKSYKII